MKFNIKYFDLEEVNKEYEDGEMVNISFFCGDASIFSNFKNVYKAFNDKDEEVNLEDYRYKMSPSGQEDIYFRMPSCNISIKVFKEPADNIELSLDISNIKEFVTDKSYVTEAIYSDYYDLGYIDYYFSELPVRFKKDSKLKVVLCLTKDVEIKLSLNDKVYDYESKKEKMYGNSIENNDIIYIYTFNLVDFKYADILKFILM